MKEFALGLSLLFSLGVLMGACGDDGASSGGCATGQVDCDGSCIAESDATLAWVQANVFDVHSCGAASCHDGQNLDTREALDLTTEQNSYDTLVGIESQQTAPQLLVDEGDSAASYLVDKLLGQNMADSTALMPLGATSPLCAPKIDGVRAWIDAGAPVN